MPDSNAMATPFVTQWGKTRAALKSGNTSGHESHNQVDAAAHLLFKDWAGTVTRPTLTASPASVFALDRSAHDAQDRRGHRMAHPASVFCAADV
jgi:hypothetical protein